MRLYSLVLCTIALLLPSVARAERINITGASATYWSATEMLEINVWYDRPVTVPGMFVSVGGSTLNWWENRSVRRTWFLIDNDQQIRGSEFSLWRFIENPRPDEQRRTLVDTFEMPMNGRHFSITIPFADTGLESPLFALNAMTYTSHNPLDIGSNSFDIFSSIDQRVIYTPEPSSVALAGIGVVAFGLHHLLLRISKRRVSTSATVSRQVLAGRD